LCFTPENSNHLYVVASISDNFDDFDEKEAKHIAYETKDSGQTFREISIANIPHHHSPTNYCRVNLEMIDSRNC